VLCRALNEDVTVLPRHCDSWRGEACRRITQGAKLVNFRWSGRDCISMTAHHSLLNGLGEKSPEAVFNAGTRGSIAGHTESSTGASIFLWNVRLPSELA